MKFKLNHAIYHGKSEINRFSINSIDINPFKNILVTCGKDFLIKIWNLGFIKNYKNNKFCYVIDNYKKSINIVRWSPNAELFASGGDDGHLVIHSFNYSGLNSIMLYRVLYNYKNIQSDIFSLVWSPDSCFISTTSIYDNIVIYSVKKKQVFAKIISKIFTIQGSQWDPLGQFFLTQSNSGGIKIWNISNWNLFKTIEFFSKYRSKIKYSQKSINGKLTWTPCGNHIILFNNSIFGRKHYIRTIERWGNFRKCKIFFHGKKFMSIVKVSPRIYFKNYIKRCISIFAVATEDGSIYFWAPEYSRVIVWIKNLNGKSFTDINWKFNGYDLFLVTLKGEVFKINFDRCELGYVLKINEHMNYIKYFCKKKPLIFSNHLFQSKGKIHTPKYLLNILLLNNFEIKKSISRLLIFFEKYFENKRSYKKLRKNATRIISMNSNQIKQNFVVEFKKYHLPLKSFQFFWVKNKYKYFFFQKSTPLINFRVFHSKIIIKSLKNEFYTIVNLSKRKSFKIFFLVKKNIKKFSIKYFYQIHDMGLKKNFVFIATTKGKIDVLNLDNFQTLFYINFLYYKPKYFKEFGKKFVIKLLKCSGLLVYC